jgi:protein-S-isoprenylcysteine O-methyltransferase Ste14
VTGARLAASAAVAQAALLAGVLGAAGQLHAPLSDPGKALLVVGSLVAATAEAGSQRGIDRTPGRRTDQLLALQSGLGLLALLAVALVLPGDGALGAVQVAAAMGMASGVVLRCLAIRALGARFVSAARVAAGGALEVTAIYRWLRHPSETGLLLFALGAALASSSAAALAIWAAVLLPASLLRVRREDRVLSRAFGDEHRRYAAAVGALVPRGQLPLRSRSKYIEPTRV